MIKKIVLKKDRYKGYIFTEDWCGLDNLSNINIFIGQNNSGKSRFLRMLFSDEDFEFELQGKELSLIKAILSKTKSELKTFLNRHSFEDVEHIMKKISAAEDGLTNFKFRYTRSQLDNVRGLANTLKNLSTFRDAIRTPSYHSTYDSRAILRHINAAGELLLTEIDEIFPVDFDYEIQKIYIPILRGLRPIQYSSISNKFEQNSDNYNIRTIQDYFSKDEYFKKDIFTGLNLYEDTKKLLLGHRDGRDNIKKFELFLSETFFNGQEVTLIPDINKDVLLIGIGNEERSVYELGDGIQNIIILLYPLFFNQHQRMVVFLEEPENSLHPGFQRILLETLAREEFKHYQYFITTHSNHFLDITLDLDKISIYTFQKMTNNGDNFYSYSIDNTSNDEVKVLDLIGARNSSVFLSNCTIWVEGITDRLYIKKFLELYQRRQVENGQLKSLFKEDVNYSFIEYGGGNIVHWSFTNELGWEKINSTRVSSKIFVLVDRDETDKNQKSKKNKRLSELKEKLGENLYVIDGTEIENILHENIVIETVKTLEKNNPITYSANAVKHAKYRTQKMGTFIQTHFKNLKRKFKAESGTIYCKLEFCRIATGLMKDFGDLSEEAKNITERLLKFIERSNSLEVTPTPRSDDM